MKRNPGFERGGGGLEKRRVAMLKCRKGGGGWKYGLILFFGLIFFGWDGGVRKNWGLKHEVPRSGRGNALGFEDIDMAVPENIQHLFDSKAKFLNILRKQLDKIKRGSKVDISQHHYDVKFNNMLKDFNDKKPFIKDDLGDYHYNPAYWRARGIENPEKDFPPAKRDHKVTNWLAFKEYVDILCLRIVQANPDKALAFCRTLTSPTQETNSNESPEVPLPLLELVNASVTYHALSHQAKKERENVYSEVRETHEKMDRKIERLKLEVSELNSQLSAQQKDLQGAREGERKVTKIKDTLQTNVTILMQEIQNLTTQLRSRDLQIKQLRDWAKSREEYDKQMREYYEKLAASQQQSGVIESKSVSQKQSYPASSSVESFPDNRHVTPRVVTSFPDNRHVTPRAVTSFPDNRHVTPRGVTSFPDNRHVTPRGVTSFPDNRHVTPGGVTGWERGGGERKGVTTEGDEFEEYDDEGEDDPFQTRAVDTTHTHTYYQRKYESERSLDQSVWTRGEEDIAADREAAYRRGKGSYKRENK
ncbi:hypothetical protein AAMO2058_001578200 [Amorphochlora amoebiformis]